MNNEFESFNFRHIKLTSALVEITSPFYARWNLGLKMDTSYTWVYPKADLKHTVDFEYYWNNIEYFQSNSPRPGGNKSVHSGVWTCSQPTNALSKDQRGNAWTSSLHRYYTLCFRLLFYLILAITCTVIDHFVAIIGYSVSNSDRIFFCTNSCWLLDEWPHSNISSYMYSYRSFCGYYTRVTSLACISEHLNKKLDIYAIPTCPWRICSNPHKIKWITAHQQIVVK